MLSDKLVYYLYFLFTIEVNEDEDWSSPLRLAYKTQRCLSPKLRKWRDISSVEYTDSCKYYPITNPTRTAF